MITVIGIAVLLLGMADIVGVLDIVSVWYHALALCITGCALIATRK